MASVLKVNEIQHTGGTSALTVASDGIINPKGCAFYMWQNTAQAFSSATEEAIQFQVELFDTHGSIVNLTDNRVDFPSGTEGIWYISFTWRLSNTVPFRHIAYVNKNNATSSGGSEYLKFENVQYSQTTGASSSVTASGLVSLAAGDYLTFTGYHGYGSARNTAAGRADTYASGFRVSSN